MQELHLTQEWDKVFPKSDQVDHKKVTFTNHFGITLAVAGPFGAVKEQSSGLYTQTMDEKGYLTIAFDPSFTGESGDNVRDVFSLDINTFTNLLLQYNKLTNS